MLKTLKYTNIIFISIIVILEHALSSLLSYLSMIFKYILIAAARRFYLDSGAQDISYLSGIIYSIGLKS